MFEFAAGSIIFDFILILNHHNLTTKHSSIVITAIATVFSSYIAETSMAY